MDKHEILKALSIEPVNSGTYARGWMAPAGGEKLDSINPTDGTVIASVIQADAATYEKVSAVAHEAFLSWRMVPAPKRGEVIRALGDELRANKEALGRLVSLEMGKILAEGLGEVQEMIDMCDFSVGLSRQLYGLAMHSERPRHRMYEQWHPLGTVGVVTAFNFPVAVWSWNTALAAVCGDPVIWKPSSNTPLTAVAVQHIANRVAKRFDCDGIFNLAIGKGSVVGQRLVDDPRVPLISFTGSTSQGRKVSASVATRFGRAILELGGNNAVIVMPDANLDMAVRAALFAAVGTAGQRCTSLRRLIVHESVADRVVKKLVKAYRNVRIGDPLLRGNLMGPLVSEDAIARNSRLADVVAEIAKEIGATPAQVALAWLLSRDVQPAAIPGTRRVERLEENWASQDIALQPEHLRRLESLIGQGVAGERY